MAHALGFNKEFPIVMKTGTLMNITPVNLLHTRQPTTSR